MGVTLQGGTRGIYQSNCFGYQFNNVQLADVTLRDMSVAGITFSNIYAWDNNLVSHVNFVNMPTAFHQAPVGAPRIDGFSNYMDKVVFYRCQITNVPSACLWPISMQIINLRTNVRCVYLRSKLCREI